jgi:hypothetical protein
MSLVKANLKVSTNLRFKDKKIKIRVTLVKKVMKIVRMRVEVTVVAMTAITVAMALSSKLTTSVHTKD